MKAIAKTRPEPGIQLIDDVEPLIRPGHVKIQVEYGSVCGTDLHIYNWDDWSSARIHPPRIIGHEFCGTIVEVGEGVTDRKPGDFVASESHIVNWNSRQSRLGQAHVDPDTRILGVDVDGGFRKYAVIPADNARPTSTAIPRQVACLQDALGNAVHTAMAGAIEGQKILITGLGPIGLFAVAICRALGAERVVGTEVSPYRAELAQRLGIDAVLNPREANVSEELARMEPDGFDGALEMSGHPFSFELAIRHTRPGGRMSLLGVYATLPERVDLNQVVFKGIQVQGIVGRRLWETWDQMRWLLEEKGLDVTPVITHEVPYTEIDGAMRVLREGRAGKIVLRFGD